VAEVLLFHHALGLTAGCVALADELRAAGHVVHTPDLYDGQRFDDVEAGVAHARAVGFETVLERGVRAADALPASLVYAGCSLGVLPAQRLAQTRPGATGALFLYGCLPTSEFGVPWPAGVPVQVHAMAADEWFAEDRSAAIALLDEADDAELFEYPGSGHLFADASTRDYDAAAAGLLRERALELLARVG
jgi:dienelactone hydrolase